MNNIVNLSQLITRLAKVTDSDPNTARRFLRTFFATIEDALAEGEAVEIDGIGTFRRCDDPSVGTPGTVGFAPAADFAEEINRPFAVFEAVELADDLTEEELEVQTQESRPEPSETPVEPEPEAEISGEDEPEAEPEMPVEEEPAPPAETEPMPEQEMPAEEEDHKAPWEIYGKGPVTIEEKEPETIVASIEEPIAETEDITEEVEEAEEVYTDTDIDEADYKKPHSRLWIWITAAILLLAGVGGYIAAVIAVPIPSYDYDDEEEETESIVSPSESIHAAESAETTDAEQGIQAEPTPEAAAPVAKIEAPPAPPAKEPRYDTVSSKRYLAIMAREYYGRSIYWVFIYEANADKLSDPNKVAPGTKVLIPDKESLPGANEAERMAIAEKKAAAIQAKYK